MMMNNAHVLLDIYKHLVWDAEDILEFGRDELLGSFEKIALSSKSRGFERIFLVRLPEICNDFEKSLETGLLSFSKGEFVKDEMLSLYGPILDRIFDNNKLILNDACPVSVKIFRQLTKCFKKFAVDCPPQTIKDKIDEFRTIELELPEPTLSWGSVDLLFSGDYPCLSDIGRIRSDREVLAAKSDEHGEISVLSDLDSIQFIADKIARSFSISEFSFRPKHGPGAVSEKFEDSKFEFPTWPERLEPFFPYVKWGCFNELNYELKELRDDSPAKLIDVPKDYKGPRLIASEPISSQYIQQGIMKEFRKSLKKTPLRFSYDPLSQEPSRELALRSSLDKSFSTIDLSSASDRLSCYVVERIFRRNYFLLQQLNAARTPRLAMPDGEVLFLRKFAAQGAAFTFPVQSIVYAIICAGVIYNSNRNSRLVDVFKKVRVYGDDMIVPTEYFSRICACLETLFLKVNQKKSFFNGYFRESCGMDAYKGNDVTAVSIHQIHNPKQADTLVSTVEISNNLYINGYIRASGRLQETIPRKQLRFIPFVGPKVSAFGLLGSGINPLPTRWNTAWQFHETLVLVVENRVERSSPNGIHHLHQWFIENPRPDVVWSAGEVKDVTACYRRRWVPSFTLGRHYDVGS